MSRRHPSAALPPPPASTSAQYGRITDASRAPPTTSPLPFAGRPRVGSGPDLDGHSVPSPALVALIIRELVAAGPTGLAQLLEAERGKVPC